MKKTLKTTLLLCLTTFVLLSAVSCEMLSGHFSPIDTTSAEETTAESTPEATTSNETTPEETTPTVTTPNETTPAETTPEDVFIFIVDGIEYTNESEALANLPEGAIFVGWVEITYRIKMAFYEFAETTPEITTPEETTSEIPPIEEPDYTLPDEVDLQGYTYKAYVRSNAYTGGDTMQDGNPQFYCEDFWVNSSKGEPEDALSYAVYMRNMEIEATYNVKIEQVSQTDNMVRELALFYQNCEKFDLTIILARSAAQAATQNLLTELKGLSGLDLTHEAYDQNSIKELSMANKLYYLSGDMNISTMDNIAPTVVNLERYENFAEEIVAQFGDDPIYADPYKLVTEGKWTMDTMLKIAALASVDADTTDGDLGASEIDSVGYFQYVTSALYYFYGAGGRLTQINDETGSPEFVIQNEKNEELFTYIFNNFNKNYRDIRYPYGYSGARKINFMTNANTLFTDMTLWDIRKDLYVNGNFEYGILPNPVQNPGDSYNSLVYFYNTVHLWAIPALCENLETAQLMMNIMAAYSNVNKPESTMNAYYERTLCFTIAPDPSAREVMNIIRSSQVYDIAILYNWGGWGDALFKLGESKYNNYGSLVSVMPNGAIPELEDTVEQFRNPGYVN